VHEAGAGGDGAAMGQDLEMSAENAAAGVDVDPSTVVSIRAAHAATGEPVVTVVEEGRPPRTFSFETDAARDRFLVRLCDACADAKAAA
jgi:hypothetical protein